MARAPGDRHRCGSPRLRHRLRDRPSRGQRGAARAGGGEARDEAGDLRPERRRKRPHHPQPRRKASARSAARAGGRRHRAAVRARDRRVEALGARRPEGGVLAAHRSLGLPGRVGHLPALLPVRRPERRPLDGAARARRRAARRAAHVRAPRGDRLRRAGALRLGRRRDRRPRRPHRRSAGHRRRAASAGRRFAHRALGDLDARRRREQSVRADPRPGHEPGRRLARGRRRRVRSDRDGHPLHRGRDQPEDLAVALCARASDDGPRSRDGGRHDQSRARLRARRQRDSPGARRGLRRPLLRARRPGERRRVVLGGRHLAGERARLLRPRYDHAQSRARRLTRRRAAGEHRRLRHQAPAHRPAHRPRHERYGRSLLRPRLPRDRRGAAYRRARRGDDAAPVGPLPRAGDEGPRVERRRRRGGDRPAGDEGDPPRAEARRPHAQRRRRRPPRPRAPELRLAGARRGSRALAGLGGHRLRCPDGAQHRRRLFVRHRHLRPRPRVRVRSPASRSPPSGAGSGTSASSPIRRTRRCPPTRRSATTR